MCLQFSNELNKRKNINKKALSEYKNIGLLNENCETYFHNHRINIYLLLQIVYLIILRLDGNE